VIKLIWLLLAGGAFLPNGRRTGSREPVGICSSGMLISCPPAGLDSNLRDETRAK
jgi:hypothetical protein